MARYDLLRCVCGLAAHVHRWSHECDRRLHKLMCYISSTTHYKQYAWVGDPAAGIEPHLYADADLGGCTTTIRSNSGAILSLRGPNTNFPLAAQGVRQSCVSTSTAESEL
eukprot:5544188-Karenia_brevis.AAC.1